MKNRVDDNAEGAGLIGRVSRVKKYKVEGTGLIKTEGTGLIKTEGTGLI